MRFDRRISIWILILCIVLLCIGGIVLYRYKLNNTSPEKKDIIENEQTKAPVLETEEPFNTEYGEFFIRSLEGELVVYYNDKETIFDKTGIDTDSLGEVERNRLKEGYYVKDEESLYALLESYSS